MNLPSVFFLRCQVSTTLPLKLNIVVRHLKILQLCGYWLLIYLIIEHGAGKWVHRSEGADGFLGKYLRRKLRTTLVNKFMFEKSLP